METFTKVAVQKICKVFSYCFALKPLQVQGFTSYHDDVINVKELVREHVKKPEITSNQAVRDVPVPLVSPERQILLNALPEDSVKGQQQAEVNTEAERISTNSEKKEKTKPYDCKECGKKFFFRCSLDKHKCGNSKGPHSCEQCGKNLCDKTFKTEKKMEMHQLVHTGEKPHVCNKCGQKFGHITNLRRHLLVHSGVKRYVCEICSKQFYQSKSLKRHMGIHGALKSFMCEICGKSFVFNYALQKHLRTHSDKANMNGKSKDGNFFLTDVMKFSEDKNFLLFALVVAVVTMSRYELVQSQTALLILLMPDTTKQDTPKTCSSAEPHLNIKQNDTQTQVAAQESNGSRCFLVEDKADDDIQTVVIGDDDDKGWSDDQKGMLQTSTEQPEKPQENKSFECEQCGKVFPKAFSLFRHKRVHSVMKQHCCEKCGKKFSQLRALETHLRKHTQKFEKKKFPCSTCGKSFKDLAAHERVHAESQTTLVVSLLTDTAKHEIRKAFTCSSDVSSLSIKPNDTQIQMLNSIMERFAKEAVQKICSLFRYCSSVEPVPAQTCLDVRDDLKKTSQMGRNLCGTTYIQGDAITLSVSPLMEPPTTSHLQPSNTEPAQESNVGRCLMVEDRAEETIQTIFISDADDRDWSDDQEGMLQSSTNQPEVPQAKESFECDQCGKAFPKMLSLMQHKRMHSIVRPHVCEKCGKKFTLLRALETHLRKHSQKFEKKKFPCATCGKSFRDLAAHELKTCNKRCNGFIKNIMISVTKNSNMLLESEVVSVLETLVKATVNEMTKVMDTSVKPPQTNITADKHDSLDFTTQLNSVLERNAKEAVEKICQLFSALLHQEMIPTAHDDMKTRLKQAEKQHKTLQGETNVTDSGLPRSQSTDQLTLVSAEKIAVVVSWGQEEIINTDDHVKTPTKKQKTAIIREEKSVDSSKNGDHPQFVVLQDNAVNISCSGQKNAKSSSVTEDDPKVSSSLSVSKRGVRASRRKKGKPFSCKQCRRKFDSVVLLRAHKVVHVAAEKPFSCSQCGRRFGSKGSLDVHYQLHTDKSPYVCSQCGKTFTEHNQLKGHQRIHNEDKTFTCQDCGKSFNQAYCLRKHQVVHSAEKLHNCDVCGKSFHFRNNLLRHKRIHTGEKPFTCQTCGRSFNQLDSLKAHNLTHTREKPHKCEMCNQGFVQKYLLRLHEGKHVGQNGHCCFVCGIDVGCLNTLKIHLPIHEEALPVKCTVCGETLDSINTLKSHQHKHSVTNKYSCCLCGKSFQSVACVKTHEMIHTGEKPYDCSVCGKTFRQQNSLKAHLTSHTGEKPFSCDTCGKGFCTLGNLRRHQRIHTGEKPFRCSECGREFNQSNSLKAHMHIHTGEKQYVCDKCGKSFAYLRNLRCHKCV
ncbi:Zinc finger protein 568 [Labeo rohita]|uniref:Zinc finger protein 568 n=2 Tax=Labeo rohita TaxID=84645 RepID=A0ABQ8M029_LABRO|nr:Zinc finger protein 568 [Labeo rohita]